MNKVGVLVIVVGLIVAECSWAESPLKLQLKCISSSSEEHSGFKIEKVSEQLTAEKDGRIGTTRPEVKDINIAPKEKTQPIKIKAIQRLQPSEVHDYKFRVAPLKVKESKAAQVPVKFEVKSINVPEEVKKDYDIKISPLKVKESKAAQVPVKFEVKSINVPEEAEKDYDIKISPLKLIESKQQADARKRIIAPAEVPAWKIDESTQEKVQGGTIKIREIAE